MCYTPGPWTAVNGWITTDDGLVTVCSIPRPDGIEWWNDPVAKANLRLIAAAPTLFEELKRAQSRLLMFDVMSSTHANIPSQQDVLGPINAVIAQVTE